MSATGQPLWRTPDAPLLAGHRKSGRNGNFKTLEQSRKLSVQLHPHTCDPRVPETGELGTRLVDTESNGPVRIFNNGSPQRRVEHCRRIVTEHTLGHAMISHKILRAPGLVTCEIHHRSHITTPIDDEIMRSVLRRCRKHGVPVGIVFLKRIKACHVQRRHRGFVALSKIFVRYTDINLQPPHLVYDRWSAFGFWRHHAPSQEALDSRADKSSLLITIAPGDCLAVPETMAAGPVY